MIPVKHWLGVFLVLYAGPRTVLSVNTVWCDEWLDRNNFCQSLFGKPSECNQFTKLCQCLEGYREMDETCVRDDIYLNRKGVESDFIPTDEMNNEVSEMSQLNDQVDADEYLARYRRQDTVFEGSGGEPAGATTTRLVITTSHSAAGSLQNATFYAIYATEILAQLEAFYRIYFPASDFHITIIRVESGSVIITYDFAVLPELLPTTAVAHSQFASNAYSLNILGESGSFISLVIGGISIQVTNEPVTDAVLCQIYEATFNCSDSEICAVSNSTPSCQNAAAAAQTAFSFSSGEQAGDSTLTGTDNGCVKLKLNVKVPFRSKKFKKIYICANGIVSFGKPYFSTKPPINNVLEAYLQNRYFIAPFHTNLQDCFISYRAYDLTDVTADDVVATAKALVKEQYGIDLDIIDYFFVATYFCGRFGGFRSEKCQFQVSYVVSGKQAFTFYEYGICRFLHGRIFIGIVNNGVPEGLEDDLNNPLLINPQEYVVSRNRTGLATYDLSSPEISDEAECRAWYRDEKQSRVQYLFINSLLRQQCPCTLWGALRSPWFAEYNVIDGITTMALILFSPFGKTCTYTRFGAFIGEGKYAGTFVTRNPLYLEDEYISNDLRYKDICCFRTNLCKLYHEVRPVQRCFWPRFRFGWGLGDPHFATLDGRNLTFNGHGEYILTKHVNTTDSTVSDFQIQTRTGRLPTKDNSLTDATIFSAFVIQAGNAWVQVELNNNGTGLDVYAGTNNTNWARYTDDFNNNTLDYARDGLGLSRNNNTLVAKFEIGFQFEVTESNGVLQYSIALIESYNGTLVGLLGNFNDDATDDLRKRGASDALSDSSDERVIFSEFGQSLRYDKQLLHNDEVNIQVYGPDLGDIHRGRKVGVKIYLGQVHRLGPTLSYRMTSADESIFKYPIGQGHSDYSFPDFVPKFIDEVENQTLVEEATKSCGAAEQQCIFDLVFTGNQALAADATIGIEQAEENQALAANQIPVLNITSGATEVDGQKYFYVTVNENKKIGLIAEDDGTLTFEFFNTTANATLSTPADDGTFEIDLVVENTEPVSLSVVAKDNLGSYSPVVQIVIVLCTGCSSHGVCNFTEIRDDERETENFKYGTCNCEAYWQGDDCEEDFDGCIGAPCAARNCTDRPADENKADPSLTAYTCGPCPTGYQADGLNCIDINECTDTSTCGQSCVNTYGSFYCRCQTGYRLAENGKDCTDIDECEQSTSGCEQKCTNTLGSFTCSCFTGFTFNSGTSTCDKDAVPPQGCATIDCSKAEGCTLYENGTAVCVCNSGFMLKDDNTCADINECDTKPCSQICSDNVGNFTCSCYPGFKLEDDKITCKACDFQRFGEECAGTCRCGQGSTCDSVHGCICKDGFSGTNCENDIDECENLNICEDTNKVCVNSLGSYSCVCRTGYTLDNGQCVDTDECSDIDLHNCEKICTNTIGSFACSCPTGFKADPANTTKCLDIDECEAKTSDCEQVCVNNDDAGRYSCDCRAGFILNADGRTCNPVVLDHCSNFTDVNCSQLCAVVNGAPECSCRLGYTLGTDSQTCIDVDECDPSLSLNMCSEQDTCVNFKGGYSCSCKSGFKLENDKRTCIPCAPGSGLFGVNCESQCACGAGEASCDAETGCVCKDGWIGEKCDTDKDECALSPCTGDNEQCINTPGSYNCTCATGYARDDNNMCKDVDECTDTPEVCSQICENNAGSYTCSCRPGYLQDGSQCTDIDECSQGQTVCSQVCTNTDGNYRCSCNAGFNLDLTDRTTCTATDVCDPDPCGQNAVCAVIDSVSTCSCKTGFKFITGSNTTCEDIAECDLDPSPCSQLCSETNGGYQCSCNLDGYKLDVDVTTCSVCPEYTYGDNCTLNCTCNTLNSLSCSNVNGTCNCKPGWTGNTCETDVNECNDAALHNCPANSQCMNSPAGSFSCKCDTGYFKTANETCQVCVDGTFGENCGNDCTCVASNTDTCNAVNGSCTCKEGWEGNTCSQDINECARNTFTCTPDSSCQNTNGSYLCNCNPGFIKTSSMTCEECAQGLFGINCNNLCSCVPENHEFCNSVNGSCTCKTGWEGNDCSVDIDECARNTFTCPENSACENTNGSYVCNCDSGYEKNSTGQCQDIDECATETDNCIQVCNNTIGSFNCSCEIGFSGTGNDCTQCVNSWGEQCVNPCNCNLNQTSLCNPKTGCVCNSGWQGLRCTEDIDECTTDPNACGANEFCNNTLGSHTCTCNRGYKRDGNSICTECSDNTHGMNCSTPCNCVAANTVNPSQSCDHINGTCYCTQFWEGAQCQTDIHECFIGSHNCTGENERCHNVDGRFTCTCELGFTRDNVTDNCTRDTATTTTTTARPGFVTVNVVITIDIIIKDDLLATLTFTLYAAEFKAKLELYYRGKLGGAVFFIVINRITNGSLIADFDVIVREASVPDVAIANAALARNEDTIEIFNQTGPITAMVVENTTVPVTTGNVTDALICQAYEASINFCNVGYECLIKNDRPTCEVVEEDNFPLIFGLGFGIPMFLLCAATVLIIAGYCRNRKRRMRIKREIADDRSSSLFGSRLPVRIVTGVPGPLHLPPDLDPYEPSEHSSSDFSDYDRRFDAGSDRGRHSQSTWNFLFHNTRGTEKFHIRRPRVDVEPWRHRATEEYY